jgi:nicotinamide riboside transporter PnuC
MLPGTSDTMTPSNLLIINIWLVSACISTEIEYKIISVFASILWIMYSLFTKQQPAEKQ